MSRISAIFGLQRQPAPQCVALAEAAVSRLPGRDVVTRGAVGGAIAWKHWGAGGGLAESEGLLVALDGALFNRDDLHRGPEDAALSDAELLCRLVRISGLGSVLARINGDFAIAVYDEQAGTMSLARDRLGLKPLYYARGKDWVGAASQPRALAQLPDISLAPNRRFAAMVGASHYRAIDLMPAESPYADIAQLPAGSIAVLDAHKTVVRTYWAIEGWNPVSRPQAELAEEYRALLLDAVKRRQAVAGRHAFTVSGGMDSSSVLCCAVENSGHRPDAYSSVYVDPTYDERDEIRDLLDDKIGTWHPVEIGNDLDVLGIVKSLVAVHEEPLATATWLSHAIVCEQVANDGFQSLFGGLGGDELNAGEYEYFPFFFADIQAAGDKERLAREIDFWAKYHDHPIYKKSYAVAQQMMAKFTDPSVPGKVKIDRARYTRYQAVLNPDWFDLSGFEPPMEGPFRSYLHNRCYQDIVRETAPCCIRAEDRQSTAHGLARFDPFYDHRLVTFMFQTSPLEKIRDGVTKVLLREAMKGILPEGTRTRVKKTGWNAPAHRWFSGAGLEAVRDIVGGPDFAALGLYRPAEVLKVIDDHERIVESGAVEENHMMFLWQMVNTYFWLTQKD